MTKKVRRDLVSMELLETASALFAEKGFSGTTLQDIADAMGVSRPALYNYVPSKEALLQRLVETSTQDTATALAAIRADQSLDPAQKLRQAVNDMVERVAENPARFMLLDRSEGHLPESVGVEHRNLKRRVLRELRAIIAEGVETGVFRPVDEDVMAFAVLGMCNWVAWWYRPSRNGTHERISETFSEFVLRGLVHGDGQEPSVEGAIAQMREDLARLERMVASSKASPATERPPPLVA